MTQRLFVDSSVLLYAVGTEHPERPACQRILQGAAVGALELNASTESIQEFLFHRLRRGPRALAIQQAQDLADLCVLRPFDRAVMRTMLTIVSSSTVGGRDAVHAATAVESGFTEIVSSDRDFDGLSMLRRVKPENVSLG